MGGIEGDTTKILCHCHQGWICEAHPDQPWPHGDCEGLAVSVTTSSAHGGRDYHPPHSNSIGRSSNQTEDRTDGRPDDDMIRASWWPSKT